MIRRTFLASALTLCTAAAVVSACSDDPEVLPCAKDSGASSIAGGLTIHYQATTSGGGTWTGITYTTDAGDIVVNNPTFPWEIDVTNATAPARIQGVGSVTGSGSAIIEYSATGDGGRAESDEEGCNLNVN
jgi:hypothetical protein